MLVQEYASEVQHKLERRAFFLVVPLRQNGILVEGFDGDILVERDVGKTGHLLLEELLLDHKLACSLKELLTSVPSHSRLLPNNLLGRLVYLNAAFISAIQRDKSLFLAVLLTLYEILFVFLLHLYLLL